MKKKVILLLGVFVLLLSGCDIKKKEKEYTNDYFKITMQDGFYEKDLAAATVYYESSDALLTTTKESFKDLEIVGIGKDSSIEDYAKAVMQNNKADYELQNKDGITYFTYEKEIQGKNFYYLSSLFKADDAFWLVTFACDTKNKDKFEPNFIKWLKTISFA